MTAPAPKVPASTPKATDKKARVPRKSANIPENETDEARFKRIAAPRIEKCLAALRRLETVGRSPAYEFTTEQANTVMKYLDGGVEKVRTAFVNRVNRREPEKISL